MQLQDLIGRIALRLGYRYPSGTPTLSSDRKTFITQRINDACRHIAVSFPEEFTHYYTQTLSAPYETGTVSVTKGSTSVTGSGTNWISSYANWWFYGPDGRLYEISGIAPQSLELTEAYVGDTESGASYKLLPLFYDLPSDCLQLVDVVYDQTPLTGVSLRSLQSCISFGTPSYYALQEGKLMLYPLPEERLQVVLIYIKQPAALKNDTDTIDIPAHFLNYLEARVWRECVALWKPELLETALSDEAREYGFLRNFGARQKERRGRLRNRFATWAPDDGLYTPPYAQFTPKEG